MEVDQELETHDLAIGGTRPALMPFLAMPWTDFVVFLVVAVECLVSRWQLLIPLAIPFCYALILYRRDYNAGRCFVCWLQTSGRHLATDVLGGTFISPAPGRCFRGIVRNAD
jgi:type IV secretory pathway VirB3-like protein